LASVPTLGAPVAQVVRRAAERDLCRRVDLLCAPSLPSGWWRNPV